MVFYYCSCHPTKDNKHDSGITLLTEARDNAGSIQTEPGGGAHDHLELVGRSETYKIVVPTTEPYIHHDNPG